MSGIWLCMWLCVQLSSKCVRSLRLTRDMTYNIDSLYKSNANINSIELAFCGWVYIGLSNSNMVLESIIDLFVVCCENLSYLGHCWFHIPALFSLGHDDMC
jgi:hypothetical protein